MASFNDADLQKLIGVKLRTQHEKVAERRDLYRDDNWPEAILIPRAIRLLQPLGCPIQ